MFITLSCIALVIGLALLVKGADRFVDGASELAEGLGMSPLLVGLTVVALGTSAPEAAISVSSALREADGIILANALGSNIVNVLVILGASALVATVPVSMSARRRDLPLVLGASVLLLALCLADATLGRLDALLLLVLLGAYLYFLVRQAREGNEKPSAGDKPAEPPPARRLVPTLALSALAVATGAQLVVTGATDLAQVLGMSERLVGLTVISLGTSLPELVTSLTAARKGQADLAVGNVVGSCLLNVLFVLGVSGAIAPIPVAGTVLFDGLVAMGAIGLVWALSARKGRISRRGGLALLGTYAAYLGCLLAG